MAESSVAYDNQAITQFRKEVFGIGADDWAESAQGLGGAALKAIRSQAAIRPVSMNAGV